MPYLILVSLIWGFSPGLIKNQLVGLDPTWVAVTRVAIAAVVFLPFLRPSTATARQRVQLAATGAVQFGLMYVFYLHAFKHLQAFEIALFTITTPVCLTLVDVILERRVESRHLAAAVLSIAGAGVIVWNGTRSTTLLQGALLVQLSNLCFAVGQLAYRRIRRRMTKGSDAVVFAWLYLGAVAVTALTAFASGREPTFAPTPVQWGVLAYLGILASGICFFLWNRGATLVNPGTLAAMNNAKIPLMVICSLAFFGETPDWTRLLVGAVLMGVAVWLTESSQAIRRSGKVR